MSPRLVAFVIFCLLVGTLTVLLPQAALAATVSGHQDGKLVVQATDTKLRSGSRRVSLYYSSNQIDNNVAAYSVGGAVSGLSGTVVLYDNGGDGLSDSASSA